MKEKDVVMDLLAVICKPQKNLKCGAPFCLSSDFGVLFLLLHVVFISFLRQLEKCLPKREREI